jgi:hypothetical protein
MKVLYVKPMNDFDAVSFEEAYGDKPSLELWDRVKDRETIRDCNEMELELSALEFGEVDPEFVKFVKEEIADYDMLKHTNFYICE